MNDLLPCPLCKSKEHLKEHWILQEDLSPDENRTGNYAWCCMSCGLTSTVSDTLPMIRWNTLVRKIAKLEQPY